jgi:membrane-bound lytic murein transglycosylase D
MQTMNIAKLLFFYIFLVSTTLSVAQHPVYIEDQFNNVKRIDSLTLELIEPTISTEKINLTQVSISEELFSQKMSSLGSKFNFVYHPEVLRQIQYMNNPNSQFISKANIKKEIYFPIFEEILDKRKLPQEIKYLSVIESALNPDAVSWCGATGLWQFMPGTGKLMKIEISSSIDERKEIALSTEKACNYLESMYNIYGDWFMALAAYNCGPGNVNKAIRRSGGKRDFWEIKHFLPKETQNYVPKFIATVFMMNFAELNTLQNHSYSVCKLVPVEVNNGLHFDLVCAYLNWNPEEIKEFNSFYKNNYIPEDYNNKKLYLPYNSAMQFIENQDSMRFVQENCVGLNSKQTQKTSYHKVRSGETIYKIANKYGVTADDIKKWNKLQTTKLPVGRTLKIVKSELLAHSIELRTDSPNFYFVQNSEENLELINLKTNNKIDLEATKLANNITDTSSYIHKGRLLKLIPITSTIN